MNEVEEMQKWQEHEELFNQNVLPRLAQLEKEQKEYRLQLGEVKNQVSNVSSEVKLVQASQGDLKNTVERTSGDLMGLVKELVTGQNKLLISDSDNKAKVSVAQLDNKGKVLIGIFGAGGIAGLFAQMPAIINGVQKFFQ